MKRIVFVPKETSYDIDKMQNLLREVAQRDHTGGNLCTSGVALDFQIEEDAISHPKDPNTEVLKIDPESGKLVSA